MADLLELAARCEAATGPDRDLDADIYEAFGFQVKRRAELTKNRWGGRRMGRSWALLRDSRWEAMQRYTYEIDAALTLVPDGVGFNLQRYWLGSRAEPAWMCEISSGGVPSNPRRVFASEDAWSPALAICAAALRARTQSAVLQHGGGA